MLRKLKFFDWILIGLGLSVIVVFAIVFFRKSSHVVAIVKVGDESVLDPSWSGWEDTAGTKTWFAGLFHKGQIEKDGLGRRKAEVLSVYFYDLVPNRKTVYLTVRLNVVYNRASGAYTYKGIPVLIGSKIKLNLDRVYTQGVVVGVEGFPDERVKRKIVLEAQVREERSDLLSKTSGTKPYVASALNVGDEVKDNRGSTLLKIVGKRVVPAQITVITTDGRVVVREDPIQKDVYLILEVNALEMGGEFFFLDDLPILVDRGLPINTSTISLFPTITKIISVE